MARTELPNGVILPAEYSDDWYEDMTSNLTKLDDVIGSDSEKLNSNDVAFLRMSSAALTDGGTGNFSDLNSSNKLKTGDYVLDSGRKLYQIVSVDSTNETFTVGNSLFKVTAESDLAPVAESGDYDDLDNKPALKPVATSGDYDDLDNKPDLKPVATSGDYDDLTDLPTYGITRFCSSAITDNSSVAFSAISSTNKIKVGDFLLDTVGKMYQISAVDTSNETVSVTTPLTQLAVDNSVIHNSGNETKSGELTVSKLISNTIQSSTGNIQVQSLGSNRSVSMFNGASAGDGGGFWAYGKDSSNGSDCRMQIYNASKSRYERTDLVGSQFVPTPSGEIDCGSTSNKWKTFNGINPGALSLPDFSNAIDISGYITVTGGTTTDNSYTPPTDGYISVNLGRSSGAIGLVLSNGKIEACVRENTFADNHRECGGFIPVQKNDTVVITSCLADSIIWAYFIPCQGNV